ncbi:hypothetical protein [Salipiger mangrovisoli]|uniref:Uncharacterized protein n=1 Tax=Salipiger mangrovisoli TaxID=2865933 RepID=A0ABR9WYB7_9RHOB|nr:hypothetical protein [Salipiger mangrovisoli]MBE9636278.1 hypothetical protein [Salipiger mangrovisoli]
MRTLDFTSWEALLRTLLGLVLFTLLAVGMRIFMMLTLQQRQQRMNRQINERLKTLIAAYKVLGGSFTGTLDVDPSHMRDLRQRPAEANIGSLGSDRTRRIRDAVEAALSDILLLGTDDQVRLAARAANQMSAGQPIQTGELVISLRDYIREALDLSAIPADVTIPAQGPTRPASGSGKSANSRDGGSGDRSGGKSGGAGGGGGMGMGLGMGGAGRHAEDEPT